MNRVIKLLIILIMVLSVCFPANAGNGRTENVPDTIYITGNPADSSHLRQVVERFAARASYSIYPLNDVYFREIGPGESLDVELPLVKIPATNPEPSSPQENETSFENLSLTDSESIPTARDDGIQVIHRKITIQNVTVPSIPTKFLAFSNHPETIKEPGLLFRAGLTRNKPVRLRYYHLADPKSQPCYVGIYLSNRAKKPARVHIIGSSGGPSKKWIQAGNENNSKFFRSLEKNLGWIEEISPSSLYLIQQYKLDPEEVISGTMDMHLLEGEPVEFLVFASTGREDKINYLLKTDETDPHVRGAYPLTRIFTNIVYSLDREEAYYTIADTPLEDIFKFRKIKGNYGVMYEYRFTLKNPYKEKKSVNFFFQPRGGIASGTFTFDGHLVNVKITQPFRMVRLVRIEVPANSTRVVMVKTMPEDASNYPVRLVLITEKKFELLFLHINLWANIFPVL